MTKRIQIIQDNKNFNLHTKEGMKLLKHSVEEVGVIESITVSNDDRIISGNARDETFNEVLGDVEPIVVETDGTRPVILKRTDIESGTKKFHEAAILANTTAQKNIDLDIDLMQEVLIDFEDIKIEDLGVDILTDNDPDGEFNEFGEFQFANNDCSGFKTLMVHFDNEADFKRFVELTGLPISVKTKSTYFPFREKEKMEDIHE
jgi:hypothetical protein